jgi:release factor glutamine methyltransferase
MNAGQPQVTGSAVAAIRWAEQRLGDAGVPSPRADAELLAAHVLGVSRGRLPLCEFDAVGRDRFERLVDERADRVPLQHLTGVAGFRDLDLAVGPGVFVPRPETEVVAEVAIIEARSRTAAQVVDLCAGSGAIGLAIAIEAPGSRVLAVEADESAAAWCARNAERLADRIAASGSEYRLRTGEVVGDWSTGMAAVDVVAANPPYIPDAAVPREPEVARHDPAPALYGGPDGLEIVRQVIAVAARILRPGGLLVMEHADDQAAAVRRLLGNGWTQVATGQDLTGRDRWTSGRRAERV